MMKRRWELTFQKEYEAWEGKSAALRELACLRVQFPAILQPVRDGDLLAGIASYRAVGFSPKDDEEFGWYLRPGMMEREIAEAEGEERAELEVVRDYFLSRRGKAVTRACMDEETNRVLPSDDLEDDYPAYPLYRMTGCIVDYHRLLDGGIPGLREEVRAAAQKNPGHEDFYEALLGALDLLADCCRFYARQCAELACQAGDARQWELRTMAANLEAVAERAPQTFWEAAQLSWLYSIVAHTLDYGRMDDYLGTYLARDLKSGAVTPELAQRIVDSMWLLIADKRTTVHGRVMVGGMGRRDPEGADLFIRYAFEATRHVRRNEPQLSMRWYEGMDPELLHLAMRLLGEGTTFPILYNDDANVPNVEKAFGVSREDAEQYYPFGCGEYVIGGRSFGSPNGVLNVARVLELTLHGGKSPDTGRQIAPPCGESFSTFEELYAAYLASAEHFIRFLAKQEAAEYEAAGKMAPFLLLSLCYDDCVARGEGMFSGGLRYLGGTLESYGNITASDSLLAIRKLVYDERRVPLRELVRALDGDFPDEALRQLCLDAPKYGNANREADEMASRMHDDLCRLVAAQAEANGLSTYLPVLINNDHNVKFGKHTGATADGRKKGAPLTNGNSPSGGMDRSGLTSLLTSMASLSGEQNAGMVQNLRLGKDQLIRCRDKTEAILRAYFSLGGTQLMVTAVSTRELRDAMARPELYQNLFVRVGGYSGRFISLPRPVQLDIISRTAYGEA